MLKCIMSHIKNENDFNFYRNLNTVSQDYFLYARYIQLYTLHIHYFIYKILH